MKIDKYSAILVNTVGRHDMGKLTENRPLATLPFGGKYRLIDFPLSSLANAGVRSVYGIFQEENISSVFDHIRSGREWGLSTLLSHYYLGLYTTDADSDYVKSEYYDQLLTYLRRSGSDVTVILNSDVLLSMDLRQVFHLHQATKREMTVIYKKLSAKDIADNNAILRISSQDTVTDHELFEDSLPQEVYNMSTDIFLVDTDLLISAIEKELEEARPRKIRYLLRDFAKEIGAFAYEYTGHVSNIYSVESYYRANLDMIDQQKFNSLFSPNQKVYTKVKNEEPTYYAPGSKVSLSQFASGSIIKGSVEGSILSRNNRIEAGALVKDSLLFPRVVVGEGARVEYAIVDKEAKIAPGVTVKGRKEHPIVIEKGQEITEDIIR
ncbi:glucose-1-phosphate adenylyltransferase subunit GlgD [Streptococcus sp. 10F2]